MVAYRMGGSTAGAVGRGAGVLCRPALRMVAMGCAKFRFIGGLAAVKQVSKPRMANDVIDNEALTYYLQIVLRWESAGEVRVK